MEWITIKSKAPKKHKRLLRVKKETEAPKKKTPPKKEEKKSEELTANYNTFSVLNLDDE